MAVTAPHRRRPSPARLPGYLVGVAVNALLLGAIHVWPGWQTIPFLTFDTRQVIPVLDAALVAGIVVNLVYVVYDPQWLKSIGDLVLAGFSLVVMVRIWQVFPFAVSSTGLEIAIQAVLAVATLGIAMGMLVSLAVVARAGRHQPR